MAAYDTEEGRVRNRVATTALPPNDDDYVFDAWTPISFKRAIQGKGMGLHGWTAPQWVGDHVRRLQAYKILAAYRDNAARLFLQEPNPTKLQEHREYGDGALICETVVAAVLGDKQEVVVDGADSVDDPVAGSEELQAWLREWADDERLIRKKFEVERDAVSLGDGVYTLGWNPQKGRVRLRCWDPGFYFPVLDDDDEFPRRVHLAWELPAEKEEQKKIRRITWELVEEDGLARSLPWNDKPTNTVCRMTDATWTIDTRRAETVDDVSIGRAVFRTFVDENGEVVPIDRLDLGIDFIPLIHMPNTVAEKEHYGRSSMATVLQILDDISNVDTDLMRAAGTTGTPPIALAGASAPSGVSYAPGTVWNLGGDGKMDVLDTSKSLDALLKLLEQLIKRMHVNSRVPEAVVGRVNAADVPSGLALALSFGPLEAMVKSMRLTRQEKDPLILKFAQRLAWANGQTGVPNQWNLSPRIVLGSYLPADQAQAVELVATLLGKGGGKVTISRETGVLMLMMAGLPIEDAKAEVERIQHEDFEGAGKLMDALGNEDEVANYLDRKAAPAPTQAELAQQAALAQQTTTPPGQ